MAFPVPRTGPNDWPESGSSLLTRTLAQDQLGPAKVVFFTMSAATPLTVVAGVVTTGLATTGLLGISLAFVLVGLVLAVFAAGYVAMSSRISNAGAFYTYVSQGLGKSAGVGAAWLALAAYDLLQVGLYGVAGVAASPLADRYFGLDAPWWLFALLAWLITGVLGQMKVDLNGRVLAVLLVAELVVIVVYSVASILSPSPEGVSFATFSPGNLFGPGLGSLLVLALLGFVGFESSAVYSEESRNTARTVRTATYVGIVLIGVLYAFSSWAMSVGVGPAKLVEASRSQQTELLFNLASDRMGHVAADVGHILFVTSVMAALISFHNTCSRYAFALGREGVLPAALGRTSRAGAPVVASSVQSVIGLVVIIAYAVLGLDPLVQLFFYAGTAGGIGVLALLALTSVAVVGFFARTPHTVGAWSAYVAPALAATALFAALGLALTNVDTLLGVPAGHPLTWIVPLAIMATLGLGAVWARYLRAYRPAVWAVIGMGPDSAIVRAQRGVMGDIH